MDVLGRVTPDGSGGGTFKFQPVKPKGGGKLKYTAPSAEEMVGKVKYYQWPWHESRGDLNRATEPGTVGALTIERTNIQTRLGLPRGDSKKGGLWTDEAWDHFRKWCAKPTRGYSAAARFALAGPLPPQAPDLVPVLALPAPVQQVEESVNALVPEQGVEEESEKSDAPDSSSSPSSDSDDKSDSDKESNVDGDVVMEGDMTVQELKAKVEELEEALGSTDEAFNEEREANKLHRSRIRTLEELLATEQAEVKRLRGLIA